MLGCFGERENRYCYSAAMHYFFQYINTKGCQATAFLDIRCVDARGATATNLLRFWNDVAFDYDHDVSKYVALACGGTAELTCRQNFSSQKLTEQN